MNRIEPIIDKTFNLRSNLDDRMELIMYALNDTVAHLYLKKETSAPLNTLQRLQTLNTINTHCCSD